MLLNNGLDVQVLGQIAIDNTPHFICKLPTVLYVNDMLVSIVVLHQKEFKDFVDKVKQESDFIKDLTKEDDIVVKEEDDMTT